MLPKFICSIKPLKEWMTATAPLKNHPPWKEWMAQADPLKEVSTVKKLMACRYSSLQIQLHTTLQNGRLQVVF